MTDEEIEETLATLVATGEAEVVMVDGEKRFRLTAKGKKRAELLMKGGAGKHVVSRVMAFKLLEDAKKVKP